MNNTKLVVASQLKTVICDVYDYKYEDENGIGVDVVFGYKNVAARIVVSCLLQGTTTTLLKGLNKHIVDAYKSGKKTKGMEEYMDDTFKIYHYSAEKYKDIRSLALSGNTARIEELKAKHNVSDSYLNSVSMFLSPMDKKHIETMIDNGFSNYESKHTYRYTIDLNSIKDVIDYIEVTSTPEQKAYDDKYFDAFYADYERKHPNDPDDVYWKSAISDYVTDRETYLSKNYNIHTRYTVDQFIDECKPEWLEFDKHFDNNLEHGSKKQYATYIPHIMLHITKPIKYEKIEKIR